MCVCCVHIKWAGSQLESLRYEIGFDRLISDIIYYSLQTKYMDVIVQFMKVSSLFDEDKNHYFFFSIQFLWNLGVVLL